MFKEGHFLTVLQENGGFPLVVASCDEVSLTMPLPNCWSNPLPWLHVDGLRDLMLCILLDNRNGTLLLVFGILPPYTTQTKHTQQINQLLQLNTIHPSDPSVRSSTMPQHLDSCSRFPSKLQNYHYFSIEQLLTLLLITSSATTKKADSRTRIPNSKHPTHESTFLVTTVEQV